MKIRPKCLTATRFANAGKVPRSASLLSRVAGASAAFVTFLWPWTIHAETIRATPPFAAFEGTVHKLEQNGGDLSFELRQPHSGVSTVTVTGLPSDARAIACDACRVVSRVQYSPRGPSQVITFRDGTRTIAAIGINTLPDVSVLADESNPETRSAARLRWLEGERSGNAAVTLEAPGTNQTLATGGKAEFEALNSDWTLHVGRAALVDSGDVAGMRKSDDLTVRSDWLLVEEK